MPHVVHLDRPTHVVIRRNDDAEPLDLFLRNSHHVAEDLTGRAVGDIVVNWVNPAGQFFLAQNPDTIVDALKGHIRISSWNAVILATIGAWTIEAEVTRAAGGLITFPGNKNQPKVEIALALA